MFSMLRPVTATFRPHWAAASSTCWMRWTLEAGALHIGGVGAQRQDPLLAQLAEAGQVDHLAVDRGGVDLEVAGMDHDAHLGVDGKGHGVGDGVVHMDEFHGEFACPDGFARVHGDELGGFHQLVLLQLQPDQSGGEAGAVNGDIDLLEHIGDGSHMVLMAVGYEQAPDAGAVLDEVGDVRDDGIDAVHVVPGKGHAAVHHDDLAAVLIGGHVFADLVQTAQGNDLQFFCHSDRNTPLFWICRGASAEKSAWKKQASVACAAPFRRQGFGHVMSRFI